MLKCPDCNSDNIKLFETEGRCANCGFRDEIKNFSEAQIVTKKNAPKKIKMTEFEATLQYIYNLMSYPESIRHRMTPDHYLANLKEQNIVVVKS